jgi:hypothetical protein
MSALVNAALHSAANDVRRHHHAKKLASVLGSTSFCVWRPTVAAHFRCKLVTHYVELMRDRQIKGLPRKLVTPVSLLTEEACVLRPCWSPRHPRARDDPSKCSCTDKRGSSHRLMRPRIVFGMIRPLPPVWFLLRHELPALSARALWFGLPATELAD